MLISEQTTIVIFVIIALLAISAFAFRKNVLFRMFGVDFGTKDGAGNTTVGKGLKVGEGGQIDSMTGIDGAGGEAGSVSVGDGADVKGKIGSMTGRKFGPGTDKNDAG
jgi:hypothetical protein